MFWFELFSCFLISHLALKCLKCFDLVSCKKVFVLSEYGVC